MNAIARTALVVLLVAPLVPGPAVADETIQVEELRRSESTAIDLDARDLPMTDAIGEIARKMGYARTAFDPTSLGDRRIDCVASARPAWDLLQSIAALQDLSFSVEEGALVVRKGGDDNSIAFAGYLVSFRQDPRGKLRPGGPVYSPYRLRVVGEPGWPWQCRELSLASQVDAQGVAREIFDGRPKADPPVSRRAFASADEGTTFQLPMAAGVAMSPWPGLSAMEVKLRVEEVVSKYPIERTGLRLGDEDVDFVHDGKAVLRLVRIEPDGGHIRLDFSMDSSAGPGRGAGTLDALEQHFFLRVEVLDSKGDALGPFAAATSYRGGGSERLEWTLRLGQGDVAAAGGLGALRLRILVPGERRTFDLSVPFGRLR